MTMPQRAIQLLAAILVGTWLGCTSNTPKDTASAPLPGRSFADGKMELVSADAIKIGEKTNFKLTLRCAKPMDQDYILLFHGYVKDENLLKPERRKYKFLNAGGKFKKPTSSLKVGDTVEKEVTLDLQPGEYNFHVGLADATAPFKAQPGTVQLGWMTLPPSAGK